MFIIISRLPRILFRLVLPVCITFLLIACGGGGGGGGGGGDGDGDSSTPSSETVTGNVVKGYISGATIIFFALNSDGSRGAELGSSTTDSSGNFSVTIQPIPTSPFLAESTGGSYVDEVTSSTVILTDTDHFCAVLPAGTTEAAVTALTNMACERALVVAAGDVPLADAVDSSNAAIANQFNLPSIISVLPVDASNFVDNNTAVTNQRLYGIVLAGIAKEADTLGVNAFDLATALATDVADGTLDGLDDGMVITIPDNAIDLNVDAGLSDLQTAIDAFLASGDNQTSLTDASVSLIATPIGINTAGTLYTTTTALPAWVYGVLGSAQISVSGGTAPYSCVLASGTPPAGLALNADCTLSGTITDPGGSPTTISPPFVVTVEDSSAPPATIDIQLYVTVVGAGPTVTPVTSGECTADRACNALVATATGGVPPYYFTSDTFANGAPPLDLVIGTDGFLTGTAPDTEGTFAFGVCAVDSIGAFDCDTTSVTITLPGVEQFDGSYTGSYSGTAVCPGFGDFPISGTSSIAISNGAITGTSTAGNISGTITVNGSINMGAVGAACPAQFTGSASGSGSWSCTVSTCPGDAGSATGSWSSSRID
jgi:hypothetical protein